MKKAFVLLMSGDGLQSDARRITFSELDALAKGHCAQGRIHARQR